MGSIDFEKTRAQAQGARSEEADAQFGAEVSITFKLPDGTSATHSFKMGHTVEFVKAVLHKEHEIPMSKQTLKFQGREMINPLSLIDIRGFEEGEKLVEVESTE